MRWLAKLLFWSMQYFMTLFCGSADREGNSFLPGRQVGWSQKTTPVSSLDTSPPLWTGSRRSAFLRFSPRQRRSLLHGEESPNLLKTPTSSRSRLEHHQVHQIHHHLVLLLYFLLKRKVVWFISHKNVFTYVIMYVTSTALYIEL